MNLTKIARFIAVAIAVCGLALTLSACSGVDKEALQAAQDNRQYMSILNNQMEDLQVVMDDFQAAVSDNDLIAMQAQAEKAKSVQVAIEKKKAPETMKDIKTQYVEALDSLNQALAMYVDVYERVQNGELEGKDLSNGLKSVQDAYDEGIEKVKKADDAVAALA